MKNFILQPQSGPQSASEDAIWGRGVSYSAGWHQLPSGRRSDVVHLQHRLIFNISLHTVPLMIWVFNSLSGSCWFKISCSCWFIDPVLRRKKITQCVSTKSLLTQEPPVLCPQHGGLGVFIAVLSLLGLTFGVKMLFNFHDGFNVWLWSLRDFVSFFVFCCNVKWLMRKCEWWLNPNKIILIEDQVLQSNQRAVCVCIAQGCPNQRPVCVCTARGCPNQRHRQQQAAAGRTFATVQRESHWWK